jgi:hypothetical protein
MLVTVVKRAEPGLFYDLIMESLFETLSDDLGGE